MAVKHKFKEGDIIRIKDKEDVAYNQHHFYIVYRRRKNGYDLWSISNQQMRTKEFIKRFILDKAFNPEGIKTVQYYLEYNYRLATEAEKVLYVKV